MAFLRIVRRARAPLLARPLLRTAMAIMDSQVRSVREGVSRTGNVRSALGNGVFGQTMSELWAGRVVGAVARCVVASRRRTRTPIFRSGAARAAACARVFRSARVL